jgi:hypothetical protein
MKRNLIYHFYPEKTKFEFHYNYLMKYKHVFTGRKLLCFSLSTNDHNVYSIDEIKDRFKDFEIFTIDNDVDARESKSFFQILLPEIINEPGITFFGHSKSNSAKRLQDAYNKIHTLWASYLYETNLSQIDVIDDIMQSYTACGPFMRTSNLSIIPTSKWHFSGTMFWFSNESLRNKLDLINEYQNRFGTNRYGVEGFLGSIFDQNKSYCLFDISGDLGAPVTDNVLLTYNKG